jgi:hypothetical protein
VQYPAIEAVHEIRDKGGVVNLPAVVWLVPIKVG